MDIKVLIRKSHVIEVYYKQQWVDPFLMVSIIAVLYCIYFNIATGKGGAYYT